MDDSVRKFVDTLRTELHAEALVALEACLDCRQCGSACAWYLGTGDPALHPKHKTDFLRQAYRRSCNPLGWLRGGPALSEQRLREALPTFWKCTTCGRCTLACPLGLSNRSVIRLARAAFARSGLILETPALRQVFEGSRDQRHSFALSRDRIHLRMGFILHHAGIEIPFDVPRADFMYVGSAVGNTRFPDLDIAIPAMLNAAGMSYTISSRLTDTGTDIEHVVVDRELSRTMLLEVEAEALRLQVPTVVISECGCDVRTFYIEAAELLGRPLAVRVQAIDSLLLQLIGSGDLPVKRVPGRVTLHDPCKLTRLSGLGDLARELAGQVTGELVEMSPNRERNYCCNGGTGPLRMPENNDLRRHISRIKADQIRATGASRVVTPCAVCMLTLEDVCQTYGLAPPGGRGSFLLSELVYEGALAALDARGARDRIRMPALLREPKLAGGHSMAARIRQLANAPGFAADLAWLRADAVLHRYLRANPDAEPLFEAWTTELQRAGKSEGDA